MKFLNNYLPFNDELKLEREKILIFISKLIDKNFGMQNPSVCQNKFFINNKSQIIEQMKTRKHITEEDFPDCLKILLNAIGSENFDDIPGNRYESRRLSSDGENVWMSKDHKKKLKRSTSQPTNSFSGIPQSSSSKKYLRNSSFPSYSPSTSGSSLKLDDDEESAKLEISKAITQTLLETGRTVVTDEEISRIAEELLQTMPTNNAAHPIEVQTSEINNPPSIPIHTEAVLSDEIDVEKLSDEDIIELLKNYSDLNDEEKAKFDRFIAKINFTITRPKS